MIDLNDLRHAMSRALDLGRYTIVVKTAGGEQVPASIALDLLERDDDDFDLQMLKEQIAEAEKDFVRQFRPTTTRESDDDFWVVGPPPPVGSDGKLRGADYEVNTRTGERRPIGATVDPLGDKLTDTVKDRVETLTIRLSLDTDDIERQLKEARERIDAAFGSDDHGPAIPEQSQPDPMPPVGPLTSTDGLKVGDVLRSLVDVATCREVGYIAQVLKIDDGGIHYTDRQRCPVYSPEPESFAFVARPGVWMPWEGGENPIPGLNCRVAEDGWESSEGGAGASEGWDWMPVIAYMVVDTPSASSDT